MESGVRCVSNAFCICSRDTISVGMGLTGLSPSDKDFTRLSFLEESVTGVLARLLSRELVLLSRDDDCADVSTRKLSES